MSKLLTALSILLGSVSWVALGQSQVFFKVDDPLNRNTVHFRTTAPLEDIVGTSHQVKGEIRVDPDDLSKNPQAHFEVDMASLDTGIQLRNTHLQEQFLDVARYPNAVFTLEKILQTPGQALQPDTPLRLNVEGSFDLHGVHKKLTATVTVTYLKASPLTQFKLPGNLLRINGQFEMLLSDYNIFIPKMFFTSVGDVVRVNLDLFATDADALAMSRWIERVRKGPRGEHP
ncbi:MAG: YceI family protein [Acidobacteriota bacterium]